VCYSGATTDNKEVSGVKCGDVVSREPESFTLEGHNVREWCFNRGSRDGDSGSPIWIEGTNTAVGILSSGGEGETCFAPLLLDPEYPGTPGVFGDVRLGALGLATQP